ncbi:MAG: tyrosine-type recombinase/integrase [Acidimicrobiia bacterium]|nr:tyrosine-type recombinase/integrase [Acidimicrobiia bacterium]
MHPERFSREFLRKQEAHNKTYADEPLPRLKLHGLRHTSATLALEEGIDIHVVSDRLDHSSTYITSQLRTSRGSCSPTPPTAWLRGSPGRGHTPDSAEGG